MNLQDFKQLLDQLHAEHNQIKKKLSHQWYTGESFSAVLPEIIRRTLTDAQLHDYLLNQFVCFRKLTQDPRYDEYLSQRNRPAGEMPHGVFIGTMRPLNSKPRFKGLEIRLNNIAQFEKKAVEAFLLIRDTLPKVIETEPETPEPEEKPVVDRHPEEIRDIASRISGIPYTSREFQKLSAYLKEKGWKISDKVQICYELNPTMNGVTLANALVCAPETLYKNSTYKRLFSKKQK
ncbi:MAG: hypothetical protein ACLFVE_11325 [Chitinispirillaceae bacterium]